MSASRDVTIWCDDPECFQWFDDPGHLTSDTAKDARSHMRGTGWVHRNGKDLCPEHAKAT